MMAAMSMDSFVTVGEYFKIDTSTEDERYEYIDGVLRMLAGGTPSHAKISANVIASLVNALRRGSCSVYSSDVRVLLSETRYVYPDITVSCDERDDNEKEGLHHPRLVVEVLSPSTESYDRFRKLSYYRSCPSIKECLLVYSNVALIELFRREKADLWTYHAFVMEDEVYLASLDVKIAVKDVYDKVDVQVIDTA